MGDSLRPFAKVQHLYSWVLIFLRMTSSPRAYVKGMLKQGYSADQIRQALINAGYSPQAAERALRSPMVHTIIIMVAGLVLLAGGWFAMSLFQTAHTQLTLSNRLVSVSAESVSLSTQVLSSSKEVIDLKVSVVLSDKGGRAIESKSESVQFAESTVIPVTFTSSLPPGTYTVRSAVVFDGKRVSDSKDFTIRQEPQQIALAVQGEEVSGCVGGCDDFNACTQDACVAGSCVNTLKSPCCGNRQCESGESPLSCSQDCAVRPHKTYAEIVEDARTLAKNDATGAAGLCSSLLVVPQADLCFSSVARASDEADYCKPIQTIPNRDDCYAAFAQKDPDACNSIYDEYLRVACVSLSTYGKS